jgi:hypothetical protein
MSAQPIARPTAAACAGLMLAAFALTGCSSAGGGGAPAAPTEEASPLDRYFELLSGQQSDEAMQKENAEVQEAIAVCMNEQGFDYVPDTENGSFSVDSSGLDWESEEFAKTYGYGITTDPFGDQQGSDDDHVDPNADYIDSLSESEQAAYSEALWGPPVESSTGDLEAVEYDWKTAGCTGSAQHAVSGDLNYWEDPEFTALSDGMSELYTAVREAPLVLQAERGWAECLADAGHDGFAHKDEPATSISEEYGGLTGAPSAPSGAAGGGAISVVPDSTSATSAPDPEKLEQLQQREIALATADFSCARESGYTDAMNSERRRLEQEFVDDNKAALDALVARYGAE